MENASKALLIAAAVLIVVLLVAFGMRIFNQSSTSADVSGTANAMGIAQFNAQFKAYEGTISKSTLEMLVNTVNTSNDKEVQSGKTPRIVYMQNENDGKKIINPSPNPTTYAVSYDNAKCMESSTMYYRPAGFTGFEFGTDIDSYTSFKVTMGYGVDQESRKRIVAIYVKGVE